MYGPPAFIGGRMTDHFPSEVVIASPFCPAMLTVTGIIFAIVLMTQGSAWMIISDRMQAMAAADGAFSARARHVEALARAGDWLRQAADELAWERLELAAEALVRAHAALGEIGGRVDADSLLGHIFASFCIGK